MNTTNETISKTNNTNTCNITDMKIQEIICKQWKQRI